MMTVVAMCSAAIALFLIGIIAAKTEIAEARGLERIVALRYVCFAIPLAVFGALHIFGAQFVEPLVPRYMPWRPFWVDFVGCALIAASSACDKDRGPLVRSARRNHDVFVCGDDPSSWSAGHKRKHHDSGEQTGPADRGPCRDAQGSAAISAQPTK